MEFAIAKGKCDKCLEKDEWLYWRDGKAFCEYCSKEYDKEHPNCKDIGVGQPCGNYPARTGDDCTFCKGQPR